MSKVKSFFNKLFGLEPISFDISKLSAFFRKKPKIVTNGKDLLEKHYLDSISVISQDELLLNANNDIEQAFAATTAFDYIKNDFNDAELFLIKGKNDWHIIYQYDNKYFFIKAGNSLTLSELRAIARDYSTKIHLINPSQVEN